MSLRSLLENGKTKLKSLRFGADNSFDRVGEGYSSQPYIVKQIPAKYSTLQNGLGNDFLLRGGTLTFDRSADDVSRLTKMFFDTKSRSGLAFTLKQNLLSSSGVRTQASSGLDASNVLRSFGGILNDGVYLPTSTIAQAGVNAFGVHLNKQGMFGGVESLLGLPQGYSAAVPVGSKETANNKTNRLIGLHDSKILDNSVVGKYRGTSIADDNNFILKYIGGPNSILGVGFTNIRFADQRTVTLNKPLGLNQSDHNYYLLSSKEIGDLSEENKNRTAPSYVPKIVDFRTKLTGTNIIKSSIISDSLSYEWSENQTIENRVNLGDPGRKGNISDYVFGKKFDGKTSALDKITAKKLYRSDVVDSSDTNDLVKFRIEAIDNDDPTKTVFIHFRAFLGTFSDTYSSTWNSTKYIGRGEEFYIYGGFTRAISIDWTVAAQSKQELIPMYQKLNYLASNLTPDYSSKGYMRGPMMRLTVGGYLYSQPGFITSLTYTVDDTSPWEIGVNNTSTQFANDKGGIENISDNSVKELPHVMKVQMSYTPIHDFVPRKQKNEYMNAENGIGSITKFGKERYIALSTGDNNNNYDYPRFPPIDTTVNPNAPINALSESERST